MAFEKGSREYAMMGDYYSLAKKYYDPPEQMTETFWNQLEKDIKAFVRKHKAIDETYVKNMTVPIIRRVERIGIERRDK